MTEYTVPNTPEGQRIVALMFKIVQQHRARNVEHKTPQQEAAESQGVKPCES